MDSYLVLKMMHILSAVVVAGTGTGIAFFNVFLINAIGLFLETFFITNLPEVLMLVNEHQQQ
jgi:uncharacterized membrane protein